MATPVRLQKVLARAGIASRRAAEALIEAGHVRVDGRIVTELGTRVDPHVSRVEVDGQRLVPESPVYVVLHKPRGVVSTMRDPQGRSSVKDLLAGVHARAYPVGRLDFNTSGVLLATNDGDFAEALTHPSRAVPKTYVVKVQGAMKPEDLDAWRRGIKLEDGQTRPARAKLLRYEGDKTWFELTITEGRNQQVRRMGDATGFRVMRLARVAFAGVTTEGLAPGVWRYLTADELTALKKEYGVPRRIVRAPAMPANATPPSRQSAPSRRSPGQPREPLHSPRSRQSMPSRRPSPPLSPETGAPTATRGRARHASVWRRDADGAGTKQPRYGGGAPARRDVDTREDWGGGIRRGSSAGGFEEGAPRGDRGGRGGRTRTTGTGGGIGAADGNYRVRGRRG